MVRHSFRSLSVRNFRYFTLGQVLSVTCGSMMFVAQDWLVLSMSGDSAQTLGLVTALQFAPVLLCSLYAGRLADRYDKRALLVLANIAAGTLALLMGLLLLSGAERLWHVYVFALALGTVNAVETPARMSFVSEMVGPDLLPNASAMSAAYFNVARIAGPAIAGVAISGFGVVSVVLLNAVSYVATVTALLVMRPHELQRPEVRAHDAKVSDGLRYLAGRPDLVLPLVLVACIGLLGFNFQLVLPLLAKTVFHTGSASFGMLTTALAAGSLAAAFVTAGRSGRPSHRLVLGAALAFAAVETAAGLVTGYAAALALLGATGFAAAYFAQAANHRIQLGSDPQYRGRVMALYFLIFQGSTPVGALICGWIADHWGVRVVLWGGGLASLAVTVVLVFVSAAYRPYLSDEPRPQEPGQDPRDRPGEEHKTRASTG
ncbi:MFS transporter [Streptomyces sp. ICC1]|uniref:MFS transporter n=1 Tax=Streptomyces sp. ICC1 TaxID=2099583 RepID=UPI0019550279|nr:MFS transporter [Streptomyces sp. ICC1]